MRRTIPAALLLAPLLAGGCWNRVDDRCPGCAIVDAAAPRAPVAAPGTRALVVLVHGAFGFGDEWDPVVAELRAARGVAFVAFRWPGPFPGANPPREARALAAAVQGALARAPASLEEVVILAHSAGSVIATHAVRLLRVPPGRRVLLAAIDGPAPMNLEPMTVERSVNTPLGVSVGVTQPPAPPVPPAVEVWDYRAEDAPAGAAAHPVAGVVYLGRGVGHNAAVAVAALPIIRRLAGRAASR